MSKLLEMSENFNESSKQQATNTERSVKAAFAEHEHAIRNALMKSERKIKSAIADHHKVTRWLILEDWMRAALIIILMLGGIHSIVWVQGRIIAGNQNTIIEQTREIRDQEQTLKQLASQTWGINLQEMKIGRFIVLATDQAIDTTWTVRDRKAIKLVEKED